MSLGQTNFRQNNDQNRNSMNTRQIRPPDSVRPVASKYEVAVPIKTTTADMIQNAGKNVFYMLNIALMLGICACFVVITSSVWDIKNNL